MEQQKTGEAPEILLRVADTYMDAMRNKALLRSRMKEAAQKREKRIESPLVRYNELGQPVCKVCNVAVKSDMLWPAHVVSRQHKEAVEELKAFAKGAGGKAAKSNSPVVIEPSKANTRSSSSLPGDFFSPEAKRTASDDMVEHDHLLPTLAQTKVLNRSAEKSTLNKAAAPSTQSTKIQSSLQIECIAKAGSESQVSQAAQDTAVAVKVAHSSLPEGFFDNIDADHRARGLEPPKYDIQDELKEFHKSIRDDVQEVDLRLEEEEFDAAEDREKLEKLEERALLERIEKLRNKQHEKEATEKAEVIAKVVTKKAFVDINLNMDDDSGTDVDSEEENILVDWRAKRY